MKRSFLWRGETSNEVYGGHSLVNWPTSCRPKIKGGLGILDLERFACALRLRWLWFQWRQKERAWNKLEIPCDTQDRDLFTASAIVTLGDGKTAKFWSSSWLQGSTPKNLAPTLFIKAKRKHITVQKALQGNKWISHITPLSSLIELHEYVRLWEEVQHIQLDSSREDNIRWRWTADGKYTPRSVYHIQFVGDGKPRGESKCRFLHGRCYIKRSSQQII